MLQLEANHKIIDHPPLISSHTDQDHGRKPKFRKFRQQIKQTNPFECTILDADGTPSPTQMICELTKDRDGNQVITLNSHPPDATNPIITAYTIGPSHIAIGFRGAIEARADFLCRYNTPSDAFYKYIDPDTLLIEKDPTLNNESAKVQIREACLKASTEPTKIVINGRSVMVQPDSVDDQRGFVMVLPTEPNNLEPNNPYLLIQTEYLDQDGNKQKLTLYRVKLSDAMAALEQQALAENPNAIEEFTLSWEQPDILPNLNLPPAVIEQFPIDLTGYFDKAEALSGKTIKVTPATPLPYVNPNGVVMPDTLPSHIEPDRLTEADGTTNQQILYELSCPAGTRINIFQTPVDTPEAIELFKRITSSHTYSHPDVTGRIEDMNQDATEYNSKLYGWIKKWLNFNTEHPYTITNCETNGFKSTFQLLYRHNDAKNITTVIGIDQAGQLIYFTGKAKDMPNLITPRVYVQGMVDPAMSHELVRQLHLAKNNRRGVQNNGSVMIPVNTAENMPVDTTLSSLTHIAELSMNGQIATTTVLDSSGHDHLVNFPPGIPFREIGTHFQDGIYVTTAELNFSLHANELSAETRQEIFDIYGYYPETILIQYNAIDIYTSYNKPSSTEPNYTQTPTTVSSSLDGFHNHGAVKDLAAFHNRTSRNMAKRFRS